MAATQDHPASRSPHEPVELDRRTRVPIISRPKALFLLAATLSFFLSVGLYFTGDHERGIFVGIWVPSILSAGALLLGKEDRRD